jgi:uncharacterized protein (DUF58 family)
MPAPCFSASSTKLRSLRKRSMSPKASLAEAAPPPMWKSFLQSMGLLVLALATALYSTGTSQAGNLPATIISALLSLVLATWVAIRFVPIMARGVDWGWMPGLAQYRITREGIVFFAVLFVVLAAAINTSNNLLYMVLSALLAVLVLSGLLSAVNFKALEMELLLPARAFAGETVPFSVRVRNRRRVFPALSLQTQPPGNSLYFPIIQPRGSALQPGEATFPRRGRYTFERLRTASRFPFGFFVKARAYPVDAECLCYPGIVPQDQLDASIKDILGDQQRMERGLGSDLYTVRDYVPSDSARHVHWKATAKTAALKTREFAADENRNIVIVFDRYGQPYDAEPFETLVSRAASLAFHLIRSGAAVTLISDNWTSPAETSEASLDAILHYLALVEMSAYAPAPPQGSHDGAIMLSLRQGRG